MDTATLGSTGLQVSRLCLGTMQFGWTASENESFAVLDAYFEAGGNFLDTANVYSRWHPGNKGGESEEIIGRWLKDRGLRDRVIVATKVRSRMWPGPDGEGLSPKHIRYACNGSLKRLQVDTIDLYQCHWFDENTPIEETLGTFGDLIKEGKVRYIGLSNFSPDRLREAIHASKKDSSLPRFQSLQPHHNLVHRKELEEELLGICRAEGLAVLPYSPLARGFLTGKYARDGQPIESHRLRTVSQHFTDDGWAAVDVLRNTAASHGVRPAAVALAWSLAQPGITAPIVGANTPSQLADQLPAVSLQLSPDELNRLDAVSQPFLTDIPRKRGR